MIFLETELPGAFAIDLERRDDERGFFARAWCEEEFRDNGLSTRVVQCNVAFNHTRGTLRGMHFQEAPHAEVKVIRCTRGGIFDVIIDLRPESETFTRWIGVELTDDNRRMLYVPAGFAHGYQTLEDDTETFYQVSEFYAPHAEGGVRWNDPAFGIDWPLEVTIVSEKDTRWPDFQPAPSAARP